MIIHLQNKYRIALSKMIKECNDEDGVADHIEVNPNEAWGILKEIQRSRWDNSNDFIVEQSDNNNQEDVRFILYRDAKQIDQTLATKLITKWLHEEISVSYRKVPIKVVQKKKENETNNLEEMRKKWRDAESAYLAKCQEVARLQRTVKELTEAPK